MRNNRLWENINKISIVFVFTVMCVITGVTNVRADDTRCTYYREITEDENVSFHRVQISYEEDSNSLNPPEVRLDFEYIADVKKGSVFSVYLDNKCLKRDTCIVGQGESVSIEPESFMEMNRRYTLALYTEDSNGIVYNVQKYYLIFHKPLVKKATTVSASQVYGEKAIRVKWDKIVGAQKYYIYRATSENGMYRNIGVCTEPNIIDDQVNIGTKYYYYIEAAYVDDDRVTTNKSSATVVSSKIKLSGPKIKIKRKHKTWQVYWGTISDESNGIEVYMKKANGKYKKINTTTKIKKRESKRGIVGITSSNKALKPGVEYSFKARTFRWVKTKKVYSKWSNTATIIKRGQKNSSIKFKTLKK